MKKKLGLKGKQQKTPVVISKRNYLVPYLKESHLTQNHLWHLSTIPSFWVEYFAKRLFKVFLKICLFSKFKIPFHTSLIRQTQTIPYHSQ